MCKWGRSVVCGVVCVSQSEWKPTAFCCQERNNAGFTETIRRVGMEVLKSIAGVGVAWGTWMCFFCPSLPMTQSRIKGGKMGQNGNQCGCRGVKHDQTAELNRVIILPKMCVCERVMEAEWDCVALLSYLVTHALLNAGTVSFPLWVKQSLMQSFDAWTFAHGPHALNNKKVCVYQTKTSEICFSICCTFQKHAQNYPNSSYLNQKHVFHLPAFA